jgi:putative ABC transport system substrate-binding protein
MNRRRFVSLLGGAAAPVILWPMAARAQRLGGERRIGALIPYMEADIESRKRITAFQQGLEQLGWIVGRNVRIDYRWDISDNEKARAAAADLLNLSPDLLLASAVPALQAAQQATGTVPIVFTGISEPIALGAVASLAKPGGNITGFTNLEASVGGKWIEVLKEIAPRTTRVAIMYNPDTSGSTAQFVRIAQAAAPKFGVSTVTSVVRAITEIEPTLTMIAREPGAALLVPLDTFLMAQYKTIVDLTARYRLPAIYPLRQFATAGGLASYGPDVPDQFRRAAAYVDRILRGEKPASLPVQQPVKYELAINLKTAKTLGLTVPATLLATADEVIE